MLNKCTLQGRLCKNPELRHTTSGVPVASFTLAVDRDFKDKQTGEKATDFIDCVAWRNTAEFVSRYFTKGRMAVVVGSLQLRDWTDKEGGKRRSAEVVADTVYFGDSRRDAGASGGHPDEGYAPPPANYPTGGLEPAGQLNMSGDVDDGELPF